MSLKENGDKSHMGFLNIKEIKEIAVKETLIIEKQKKYSFSEVALVILNNIN